VTARIAQVARITRTARIARTAQFTRITLLTIALLAAPAAIAEAQLGLNCTISTTPVAFGDYNVLSPTPKTTTGSVTYQCTLGVNIIVTLGRGSSATFNPRTMRNGAEVLNYNLYREAALQTIWGDGTGGTQTYTALATVLFPTTVTVYAQLPAGQDVAVGSYSDSVVATIIF
jgi:spore coat protein U-like protein